MPKVSVVVPVYGVEAYIGKCMKSLLNQTCEEFAVFIVDDGSKDNSINIAKEIVKDDDRFVFLTKENGGLSDARNFGLKHVTTEYVMFIDSDDFVEKDFIEKALSIAEYDVDILVFNYNAYYADGTKELMKSRIEHGVYNLAENKEILAYMPNAAWNKIYKTSLFKDNEIEYPKGLWYEDLSTTPKLLLKANRIAFIDDSLYNYLCDRPNNISTTVSEKILHIVTIMSDIVEYFKKNNCFEDYYDELQYLAMRNFIKSLRLVVKSSDKRLVKELRDKVFGFINDNFYKKGRYEYCLEKGDDIYCSKLMFNLYYLLKRGRLKCMTI